jgi:hypothetical protein
MLIEYLRLCPVLVTNKTTPFPRFSGANAMVFLPLLLEPLATESLLRTQMAVIIEAIFSSPYVLIPTASSTSCTCPVAPATTGMKKANIFPSLAHANALWLKQGYLASP